MSKSVGFVGLGIMGRGMARNLLQAGFELRVVDESLRVDVDDPVQIDSFAARVASGVEGNITGTLAPGTGGVNQPWS